MSTERLDSRSVRLEVDYLTRSRYERARSHYGVVRDCEASISSKAPEGEYLTRDLFAGLYDPGSRIDPQTDGTALRRILDWTVGQLEALPEWRSIANQARGNVIAASLATEAVVDYLQTLDWPAAPAPDRDAATKESAGLESAIEWQQDGSTVTTVTTRNGKPTSSSRTYGSAEGARGAIEKAKRAASRNGYSIAQTQSGSAGQSIDALAAALESDPSAGPMMRGRVVSAVRRAQDASESATDALSVAYGTDGVSGRLSDPDQAALKLADSVRYSPELSKFLRLVGSMLQSMKSSQNRQRVRGHVTPYDVEPTRDVRRLLPAELALLGHAGTRPLATLRIMQGHALGSCYSEMGTKERGPMFVALDLSGSMEGRQSEAKAFAVAAALHAADNGRRVSVATFTTRLDLVEHDASDTDGRAALVREILTRSASGGTDFRPVVRHVETLDASMDVLLISDGQGSIDGPETAHAFARRALHYLVIGDHKAVSPILRSCAGERFMTTTDILSGRSIDFASSASAAR
jgi:hypothetical protein